MLKEIVGLGTDVVNVLRFKAIVTGHGLQSTYVDRLARRILNPKYEYPKFAEIRDKYKTCNFENDNEIRRCCYLFAGSWASKEALFKTLDLTQQKKFEFKNWYKTNDSSGRPSIQEDGNQVLQQESFMLSLSHDNDILIATVLRQRHCNSNNDER